MAKVKFQFEFIVPDNASLEESLDKIREDIEEDGLCSVINESNVVNDEKTRKMVYIVINANNESITSSVFLNYGDAEALYNKLAKAACNPDAYYIRESELV